MFKKIAALLLSLAMCGSLFTACGEKNEAPQNPDESTALVETSDNENAENIQDAENPEDATAEQSAVSKISIPDKYKLKAPIGMAGTTKPEFSAETGTFICDKYILRLDDTWACERAYEDFTGVYGYISKAYGGSLIITITDEPDLPKDQSMSPLEYYEKKLADDMAEYTLRESVVREINGVQACCYWYEHPSTYMNILYAFYNTEHYTYQVSGSFTESESAFYCIQDAISSFKTIDTAED